MMLGKKRMTFTMRHTLRKYRRGRKDDGVQEDSNVTATITEFVPDFIHADRQCQDRNMAEIAMNLMPRQVLSLTVLANLASPSASPTLVNVVTYGRAARIPLAVGS